MTGGMTEILDGEQTRKKGFRAKLTVSRIRTAQVAVRGRWEYHGLGW